MSRGFVKLWRQTSENVFLMKDNNAYAVFTKLLIFSNSNGQWAGGRRQLAELVNLNDRTLLDVLQRLQSNHMISISPTSRYTTYTICNWAKYQTKPNQLFDTEATTAQPQPNHSPTTAQHSYKNKNKNKNKNTPAARATVKIDQELNTREIKAREPRPNAGTRSLKDMFQEYKNKPREATI